MFNNNPNYEIIILMFGASVGVGLFEYGAISKNISTQADGAFVLFFTIIWGIAILGIKVINARKWEKYGDEK
jgi:hypothetical protein